MSPEIWNLIWALKAPEGPKQRSQKLRYWRNKKWNKSSGTWNWSPTKPTSILRKLRLWRWFGKYLWNALWGRSINASTDFDQSRLSKWFYARTSGACQTLCNIYKSLFWRKVFEQLKDNESFEIYGCQPSSTRDYIIQEIIDIDAKYISQLKVIDEVFKERNMNLKLWS